jgi:hypothetical protein
VNKQTVGVRLQAGAKIIVSRLHLRPTEPSIQWVPGIHSSGIKRSGTEADYSRLPVSSLRVCGPLPPMHWTFLSLHTLCRSLQHVQSLLNLLYLHWLSPSNRFQSRSFLRFRLQVLTGRRLSNNTLPGWRPSHTNILLFSQPSQNSLIIAAAPRYIASARTAQKTPLPTVFLSLRHVIIAWTA